MHLVLLPQLLLYTIFLQSSEQPSMFFFSYIMLEFFRQWRCLRH